MTVRSNTLYGPGTIPGGAVNVDTTLYTVPADVRTIWKGLWVNSRTASARNLWLSVKRGASRFYVVKLSTAAVDVSFNQNFWHVLQPGDLIQGFQDGVAGTSSFNIWLSGAELEL